MIHVLASILAWASAVINPFIYAFSNRQYRSAYRQLLFGSSGTNSSLGGGRLNNANNQANNTATSRSCSAGRTFITEMLHYTAHGDKVKVVNSTAVRPMQTPANNQHTSVAETAVNTTEVE